MQKVEDSRISRAAVLGTHLGVSYAGHFGTYLSKYE